MLLGNQSVAHLIRVEVVKLVVIYKRFVYYIFPCLFWHWTNYTNTQL